jgi:nitrogen fixation NifU-like protein
MSDLAQLYQASILEHHARPRNPGRLPEPTHHAQGNNPLCGDRLTVTLRVSEGQVSEARCDARGCAICRASGSLMTEAVIGRSCAEVRALAQRLLATLRAPAEPGSAPWVAAEPDSAGGSLDPLAPLDAILHVRHFPGRVRCATLSWEVLESALGPLTARV